MFLAPSPPRMTRRSRLEHWWLLALRLLALCLIAAAFTRPFLRRAAQIAAPAGSTKQVALLLDVSASMNREGVWQNALASVEEFLRQLDARDSVSLFTFDNQLHPVVSFHTPDCFSVIREQLGVLRPSWQVGDLGTALVALSERMAGESDDEGPAHVVRQIVVFSDFQQGMPLAALRATTWPSQVEVIARSVRAQRGNASLQILAPQAELPEYRVRIINDIHGERDQLSVRWFTQTSTGPQPVGGAYSIYVPAGQTRVLTLRLPDAFQNIHGVMLEGDDDPYGNLAYVAPVPPETVRVLFFGDDRPDDPEGLLFYLTQALIDTPRRKFQLIHLPASAKRATDEKAPAAPHDDTPEATPQGPHQAVSSLSLEQLLREDVALLVAAALPTEQQAQLVRRWIEQGGAAIIVFRSAEEVAAWSTYWALGFSAEEATEHDYALWTEIKFDHPLFAHLADVRYRDFTKIRFWKYRRLLSLPPAQHVALFDSGDPAIVELSIGMGRLLLFASGWHPTDSQWAVSTKWVPMLEGCLAWAGIRERASVLATVGMSLFNVWQVSPETPLRVDLPDGSQRTVTASQLPSIALDRPGIYHLHGQDASQAIGVNLDPRELNTSPQDPYVLEQFGVQMGHVDHGRTAEIAARQMRDRELESRQRLWWWLVAAATVILLVETWLAGRTARRIAAA